MPLHSMTSTALWTVYHRDQATQQLSTHVNEGPKQPSIMTRRRCSV